MTSNDKAYRNLVLRLFPLCEGAEEKPWFRLVSCLPDIGRLQKSTARLGGCVYYCSRAVKILLFTPGFMSHKYLKWKNYINYAKRIETSATLTTDLKGYSKT